MSAGISGAEIANLSKEYSQLKPVVEKIEEYKLLLADLREAEDMMSDPDMRQLAEEELPILKARVPEVEKLLQQTYVLYHHFQFLEHVGLDVHHFHI